MIISKQFVKEVNGFWADKTLVFRVHKALPGFLGEPAEDVVVLGVQLDVVLVQVFKELVCS